MAKSAQMLIGGEDYGFEFSALLHDFLQWWSMPAPNFCSHNILDHIFHSWRNEKWGSVLIETVEINLRQQIILGHKEYHNVCLEKSNRQQGECLALSIPGRKQIRIYANYILWEPINMPVLYYNNWKLHISNNNKKLNQAIKWLRYQNWYAYLEENIQILPLKIISKSKPLMLKYQPNVNSQ